MLESAICNRQWQYHGYLVCAGPAPPGYVACEELGGGELAPRLVDLEQRSERLGDSRFERLYFVPPEAEAGPQLWSLLEGG